MWVVDRVEGDTWMRIQGKNVYLMQSNLGRLHRKVLLVFVCTFAPFCFNQKKREKKTLKSK